jgi:hypothetical protein
MACLGERTGVYRVFVGKPLGKRPLARTRCRWEDNIKMYVKQMGWWPVKWIDLAQDWDRWRVLVNVVIRAVESVHKNSDSDSDSLIKAQYVLITVNL